jgi:hypothetical protein
MPYVETIAQSALDKVGKIMTSGIDSVEVRMRAEVIHNTFTDLLQRIKQDKSSDAAGKKPNGKQ